jgi:hypothetical protein
MASKRGKGKSKQSSPGTRESHARPDRFQRMSRGSSQIVKEAAVLLDDEIAAGIVAAKQMQQRFQSERRIDPGDMRAMLTRFRSDAHEMVTAISDQFAELRSEENAEIATRFAANAHGLLDVVVELVNTAAEMADQLVQSSVFRKRNGRAPSRSSRTRKKKNVDQGGR